ncbi:MAG: hypothetical protein JRM95_06350 [Nitrososphaerota archaeon]|nr:hypothetical protein [Nitrososphaerota archaeon]
MVYILKLVIGSGKEDPIQRALSGLSLYTLGDGLRQGTSIAVVGKELERYEVGPATVIIANDGGVGRYLAIEPSLTDRERERLSRLLDHLFMSISPEDAADPSKRLVPNMVEAARSLGFLDEVTRSLQKYEYYVKRELKGYGRLDVLMNDFNIEDSSDDRTICQLRNHYRYRSGLIHTVGGPDHRWRPPPCQAAPGSCGLDSPFCFVRGGSPSRRCRLSGSTLTCAL